MATSTVDSDKGRYRLVLKSQFYLAKFSSMLLWWNAQNEPSSAGAFATPPSPWSPPCPLPTPLPSVLVAFHQAPSPPPASSPHKIMHRK